MSEENPKRMRGLKSEDVGKLIKIQGLIINAGKVLIKGKTVILKCKYCGH